MVMEVGKYLNIVKKIFIKYYNNFLAKISLLNNLYKKRLIKYNLAFLNNQEWLMNLANHTQLLLEHAH